LTDGAQMREVGLAAGDRTGARQTYITDGNDVGETGITDGHERGETDITDGQDRGDTDITETELW
jgi:hypothetical protein